MGLDTASVMFLCGARSAGVDFTRMAMIGRQSFFPEPAALGRVFNALGIDEDADQFVLKHAYGERFFSLLGAQEITSLDCSSYEDASVIHDMNLPIPGELRQRFSVVYDGGTIEHVFNITQAFKNCMEMVEVGGHFVQTNVANNWTGHGFWQFSPELLFRMFTPANGFEIEAVLMHEVVPGGAWYAVADPDEIKSRVELRNNVPTYILTVARRASRAEIFATPPIQSDYVGLWQRTEQAKRKSPTAPVPRRARSKAAKRDARAWQRYLPSAVKRALQGLALIKPDPPEKGTFQDSCYKRISEAALLRGELAFDRRAGKVSPPHFAHVELNQSKARQTG
jgi:hypothetical protein